MRKNEAETLKIARLLTPKHRADLLTYVRLAYAAECSVRKSFRNNAKGSKK